MKASVTSPRSRKSRARTGPYSSVYSSSLIWIPDGTSSSFRALWRGVLADSVALVGDAGKVVTIADPSFAQHGVRFTGMDPADRFPEALPQLADLIATGKLDLPVWRTYPLGEAAQAHADIEARRNQGKVVLLP